jgi:tetratricopeptide (TPR) repeat protein
MRQSHLRFCALFFATAHPLLAPERAESPVARAVQSARGETVVLTVRRATAEEWERHTRALADLAARHPREPAVHLAHAEALWEREDREGAIRAWEQAEQLAPGDAALLAQLADAHLAIGHEKQCAAYFAKACAVAPDDARLRHAAGNALFLFRHALVETRRSEAQIVAEALGHLAAAARLAPQQVEYARAYAETFYGVPEPDWAAALAAWQHYLSITPHRDFAHAHLARVRLRLRQYGAAREELQKIQGAGFEGLKATLEAQIATAASGADGR